MKFTPVDIDKYLALLEENIQRLQICMQGHDEGWLNAQPQKEEWSAVDILRHLRACAEVWSTSIYTMLAEENPSLPDIHPRRWAKIRHYDLLAFGDSFTAYRLGRQELLLMLRGLSEREWGRTAEIGGRTHSVFSQARRMARHEAGHCKQIEELLSCSRKPQGR